MNFSTNINEVIRAVLNFLLIYFSLKKDFVRTKSTKMYQKCKKAQKAPKNTEKHTQKKTQISEQK